MILQDRIKTLVEYSGLTIPKFSAYVGFKTPQAVRELIKGNTKTLSDSAIHKIIIAYPEISEDWLLTGEGEMLKPNFKVDEIEIPTKEELKQVLVKGYWVPLIPTEALANSLAEYIGPGVRRTDCQNIISPVPGAEFAITISGDSMEPKFHDGMVVFLKKINDAAFIPWGNTLVLDTENGAFIKDVFPVKDNESLIEARSLNTIYPPLIIPKSSIYGMYRVLNATKFFTTM
ncbi:S24 family peptidase [Duncaniella muris]|jgi:phage repressor protein C with HTH and peptisase S24 domain|uniref:S24 family peptidase n=1 Tax=Duncaniella muris TaxID=2094150 RepID=UPI00272C9058|nr:S24 family peptidase [Duncaniella muris]